MSVSKRKKTLRKIICCLCIAAIAANTAFTSGVRFLPDMSVTAAAEEGFTVTLESDGVLNTSEIIVPSGAMVVAPPDPIKPNYIFDGWYTDVSHTTRYDFNRPVTSNFTLYANWIDATKLDLNNIDKYVNKNLDGTALEGISVSNEYYYYGITLDSNSNYTFKGSNFVNGAYVDVQIYVPYGVTATIDFENAIIKNTDAVITSDGCKDHFVSQTEPFYVDGTLTVTGTLSVDTTSAYIEDCHGHNGDVPINHDFAVPLKSGTGTLNGDFFTVKYLDEDGKIIDVSYYHIADHTYNALPAEYAYEVSSNRKLVSDTFPCLSYTVTIVSEDIIVTALKDHIDSNEDGFCDNCSSELDVPPSFTTTTGGIITPPVVPVVPVVPAVPPTTTVTTPEETTPEETTSEATTPEETTPENTTTAAAPDETDNGPQIKGNDGKSGWNAILSEISDAEPGDTIVIDMNGTTELPKDILNDIMGKDINIVLDMGDGFTWTINGQTVIDPKDIDLSVSKKTGIPVKVINNLTGECSYVTISLAHEGDFGFEAVLTVDMGVENKGTYANLYYYNEADNTMEYVCAGFVGDDGKVDLTFNHASEYIIVIDDHDHGAKSDAPSDAETGKNDNPSTGVALGALGAMLSAAIAFVTKKKK